MTFRSLVGTVVSGLHSRQHPAWWLRARYGASERSYGAMFCPRCLDEDRVPHFRLAWRLGFNVVCPQHAVLYLDQCQECGAPPWPGGCGRADQLSNAFTGMDRCWRCGALLSKQRSDVTGTVVPCYAWLKNGHAPICDEHHVPAIEGFAVLRAMCQLFIRNKTRTLLLKSGRWPAVEAVFKPGNAVEHFCARDRYVLLQAAMDILSEWPDNFLSISIQCGISRSLFNGTTHMHPKWVDAVINSSLAKQNRWVTEEDVRRVVANLRDEGGKVTKGEIWRRLDWWGRIDNDWLQCP